MMTLYAVIAQNPQLIEPVSHTVPLRLIFKWRDQTARSEDESTAFVLPNHMMFKIAELLPGDQEGWLTTFPFKRLD